jgi:hypothetical protein
LHAAVVADRLESESLKRERERELHLVCVHRRESERESEIVCKMDKRLSMDPTMLLQMKSMLGPGGRGGPAARGGRGGSTQPHQPSGLGSSHSAVAPGSPPGGGRGRGGIKCTCIITKQDAHPPPPQQPQQSSFYLSSFFCPSLSFPPFDQKNETRVWSSFVVSY